MPNADTDVTNDGNEGKRALKSVNAMSMRESAAMACRHTREIIGAATGSSIGMALSEAEDRIRKLPLNAFSEKEPVYMGSLKPCPFCGETEALGIHSPRKSAVLCGICFTEGPQGEYPRHAREGWNTRFPYENDFVEAEREACIRLLEDMRPRNDVSDWNEFTVTTDTILRLAIEAINARYPDVPAKALPA